ncbi:MAG: peptidyl-prolyl cis-trans isomerase [Phycisphaerae bacterium]|nr:peptidyl-prolyl cis-trans isomerase [Phycisphaerae bacterium]
MRNIPVKPIIIKDVVEIKEIDPTTLDINKKKIEKKVDASTSSAKNPKVIIETSMGKITLELDAVKAPITTANFIAYAKSGFYDGTIFHRIISDFMIQGGGMTSNMTKKPTNAPIKNESKNGLKNKRGTIAMARTQVLDSATSQFFINVKDNTMLDYPAQGGYAVFGKVVDGMDVVDKIRYVKTGTNDVPTDTVLIKSVKLVEEVKKPAEKKEIRKDAIEETAKKLEIENKK